MTVKERIKQVIADRTRDRTRYIQLKELTGISGDIWKNFWFDRREPDAAMIEAISRAWPEYAFWLATGGTDCVNGHMCPPTAFCFEARTTPLTTATPFLALAVKNARLFDSAVEYVGEENEEFYKCINDFLKGESIHKMPNDQPLAVDDLFKSIRALNQAAKVRAKEAQMQDNDDN